ncbi:MAG: hypothetical protein WED00_03685 [Aquisalimonadaceae bacterium]
MKNPSTIAQSHTPLCGPAAFLYCVASKAPDVYARYILDLCLHGEASIGGLRVRPSAACRNASLDGNINAVDWIGLASLRDSENRVTRLDAAGGGARLGIAGLTMPGALRSWFAASGLFASTYQDNDFIAHNRLDRLLKAGEKHEHGAFVCLLVRAAILGHGAGGAVGLDKLGKGTPKSWLPSPDHWVVMSSPLHADGLTAPTTTGLPDYTHQDEIPTHHPLLNRRLTFTVYTWGRNDWRVDNVVHPLTVEQFLPYFHGFVAAR